MASSVRQGHDVPDPWARARLANSTVKLWPVGSGPVPVAKSQIDFFCRDGFGLSSSPRARSPEAFFAGPHQPAARSPARKTRK